MRELRAATHSDIPLLFSNDVVDAIGDPDELICATRRQVPGRRSRRGESRTTCPVGWGEFVPARMFACLPGSFVGLPLFEGFRDDGRIGVHAEWGLRVMLVVPAVLGILIPLTVRRTSF